MVHNLLLAIQSRLFLMSKFCVTQVAAGL